MSYVPLLLAVAVAAAGFQQSGEKPVDSSSARVSIKGCLRGRSLVVVDAPEGEPVNANVAPGRVFRLAGSKVVMNDVKKRDRSVVELTGLVRKSSLSAAPQGMPIAGGRIRIGGMPMNQDPTRVDPKRDPLSNVDLFDIESIRPADGVCPSNKR